MTEVSAYAHGRVNLIGEHTDYNGGWVLPTAIPQKTTVRISPLSGARVEVLAAPEHAGGQPRQGGYEMGREEPRHEWLDYIKGATKILAAGGARLKGFRLEIESDVPEGSGLSSSAALEIAVLKGLREINGLPHSDQELARIGQQIENEFVGARVGIMDQMACSLAQSGVALFLDTLNLSYEQVKLPLDQMDLIIINSGISHRLSATDGGYNQRRAECEKACAQLGINLLRDISWDELQKKDLPEQLMKRARHVVKENERVHKAVAAIKKNDLVTLGKLFVESHQSMRDDYQVSIPEIDTLVELCMKDAGTYGARLTGGGFGGSIVAITKKGEGKRIADAVVSEYKKLTGVTANHLA